MVGMCYTHCFHRFHQLFCEAKFKFVTRGTPRIDEKGEVFRLYRNIDYYSGHKRNRKCDNVFLTTFVSSPLRKSISIKSTLKHAFKTIIC